ncbi:hypothetical protein [Halopseudomonas salegens]|uniref:Uncharacterized protein n=1 Tax=Halopseudomonas salegens TaxID=1434072 RepID=A0A1H2GQ99_9GAMM|nr:hypothetical protein [Halopseudomonas salegens]SDU21777.1 hypothetical protein SAMN05216210_2472 [Halopseudomonas salegens]
MTTHDKNAESTNWLISLFVVIFVPMVACTPYLLLSTAYGTLNPEEWTRKDSSISLLTAFIFILFSLAFYFVREKNINIHQYINKIIDLKELQDKKYIDFMLAHYGNVASLGVIMAVLAVFFRKSVNILGISFSSLAISILLFLMITVYGLIFTKAVHGALNKGAIVFSSLIIMLILDVAVMQLAINSIPK